VVDKRTYDRGQLRERTRFVWDGDTIAHAIRTRAADEGDPIVEERTYCFEDGGFVPWAQGDAMPDGYGGRAKSWAYFVNDPIGTPEELLDGAGVVRAELDREAWGRTTTGGEATPLRFQGQQEDEATGLHYNRHRYYDPEAGLFLSPDPIGIEGGLRGYGYGDNPTGWVDPLGLTWRDWQKSTEPASPLHARADEIHDLLPNQRAKNQRTTAVVTAMTKDGCPMNLVASSQATLDPRQRAGLRSGELAIRGRAGVHAEVKALDRCAKEGWTPMAIAASRPICGPCKVATDGAGAGAASPLKKV
jgi:RHS repeat-associated protein